MHGADKVLVEGNWDLFDIDVVLEIGRRCRNLNIDFLLLLWVFHRKVSLKYLSVGDRSVEILDDILVSKNRRDRKEIIFRVSFFFSIDRVHHPKFPIVQ